MSTRRFWLTATCGALGVALGLAAGAARAAYSTNDPRIPSPQYTSETPIFFSTPDAVITFELFKGFFPPSERTTPPDPGMSKFHSCEPILSGTFTEALRPSFPVPFTGFSEGAVFMENPTPEPPSGTTTIPMELQQMDLKEGSLPPGMKLRENPLLLSQGVTTIQDLGGGMYLVDSFFDVFFELSLDNGLTWTPSLQPMHISGSLPEPGTVTMMAFGAAFLAACRRRAQRMT